MQISEVTGKSAHAQPIEKQHSGKRGVDVVVEAANLYRRARRAGLTVCSGIDCLIAACAIRNALPMLHRDRDFAASARVSSAGGPRRSQELSGRLPAPSA